MGILDKVKDAATKATEQAKHGVALGKEKVEETKLRKQIDESHEGIGRLVVLQRLGSAPADADVEIDAAVGGRRARGTGRIARRRCSRTESGEAPTTPPA